MEILSLSHDVDERKDAPEPGACLTARRSLHMRQLLRQRGPVAAVSAMLLLQSLVTVSLPLPLRFIINRLLVPSQAALHGGWISWLPPALATKGWLLTLSVGLLALLALLTALLDVAQDYWTARAINSIIEGVRADLVDLMLTRRQSFVDNNQKAEIVGRISNDTASLEAILSYGLPVVMGSIPTLLMVLFVLFRLNHSYALLMLALVSTMYLCNCQLMKKARWWQRKCRHADNRFQLQLYETLNAFPLIKSLSMEKASFKLMADSARAVAETTVRGQIYETLMGVSVSLSKALMRVVVLGLGGFAAIRHLMSVGDLIVFLSYIDSVTSPVREMSRFTVKLTKAVIGNERIEELVTMAQGQEETGGNRSLNGSGMATLRLRDVSLAHPRGPIILRNFCAYFNPGDLVAVVGQSGAGKSSFLRLFNRLADPTEGELLLGEQPMDQLRLSEIRDFVTAIPQEEFFMAGTIRENLQIGCRHPLTDEELWRALDCVHARRFVSVLPSGLDTRIGEGGVRLSGGEQRRLNVARAFLRPARGVFIFDEPTSGLDPESANVFISSVIDLAARGAIVLWSTHRMEEIGSAGRVLFFQRGRNPMLADHQELASSDPAYAAFLKAGSETPRPVSPSPLSARRIAA